MALAQFGFAYLGTSVVGSGHQLIYGIVVEVITIVRTEEPSLRLPHR